MNAARGALTLGKLALCYVGAGAIYVLATFPWEGHAHIPGTGFPGMLMWSPLAPVFLASDLSTGGRALVNVAIFVMSLVVFVWLSFRRAQRAA
jgi:hypothetical protein